MHYFVSRSSCTMYYRCHFLNLWCLHCKDSTITLAVHYRIFLEFYRIFRNKKTSWKIRRFLYKCRLTGIRTPTDGTKNRSATVTPWVYTVFGGANLIQIFLFAIAKTKKITKNLYLLEFQTVFFITFSHSLFVKTLL